MSSRIDTLAKKFTPKEDSSNIKKVKQYTETDRFTFATIEESDASKRLKKITLKKPLFDEFLSKTKDLSVFDLEHVAAYRFFIADILNDLCDNKLRNILSDILHDRKSGAFIFNVEGFEPDAEKEFDKLLKLSTGVSYLFGKSNLDSMTGLYYARFSVQNDDDSDSFLRKFAQRMTMHNDGSYVNELTDYVLMMKVEEKQAKGGNSLLLHLDDWEDLNEFYAHPLSGKSFKFASPPSKRTSYAVHHPIFHQDKDGNPCMLFIDQFIKPQTPEEGRYIYAMMQSIESSPSLIGFHLPPGSFIVCNNHFWLHGRDKFDENTKLYRELLRQRGVFFDNLYHQPYPDQLERF